MNQIAMSVMDLERTHGWYCRVFGFEPAGGTDAFRGYFAEKVQGIPGAASTCWWLVDQKDYFQLELFEFQRPTTRPMPDDWRLCDIGYGMVGLHVRNFDTVMARLQAEGSESITPPTGAPGQRRVCVRDPEGVLLELLEQDPCASFAMPPTRPDIPVSTRFITISVPDLEQSTEFFSDVLGLQPQEGHTLHAPEHEALWGLAGADRLTRVLRSGDMLVELVQYLDPIGKPWPDDYRISDQGLLNIALGFRNQRDFNAAYKRCLANGARGNWRPLKLLAWSVVYVNDALGFSVELLMVRPWYDSRMGFLPRPVPARRGEAA
ncbi:MAG: VOC family protein [Pseudomonadota bacterium]